MSFMCFTDLFCFSSGLFFQVISLGSLLIQGFHDLAADAAGPKSVFLCLIMFPYFPIL